MDLKTNIIIGYSTNRNSYQQNIFNKEIKKSIGLKKDEYCIIPLENNGQYSLTEAYNIIWKQAEEMYPFSLVIVF